MIPSIQRISAVRRSWPRPTRGDVRWHLFLGWTDEELRDQLTRLERVGRNFDASWDQMTPGHGWDRVRSHAVIASEPAGPPQPDGPFEQAWTALLRYEFSDPRVVRAHFDPDTPLEGRRILLELQILGLRYLCPVRVGEVRRGSPESPNVRGYRIDTLKGHIEAGSEWFLIDKDPHSGDIRFRIEAAWRIGEFPNLWSWAGFLVFARRYQRAWHRLAHLRMHELATRPKVPTGPIRGGLEHEGVALPTPRVHDVAGNWRWENEEERIAQTGLLGAQDRRRR